MRGIERLCFIHNAVKGDDVKPVAIEPTWQYELPGWFLDNHVRKAEDLKRPDSIRWTSSQTTDTQNSRDGHETDASTNDDQKNQEANAISSIPGYQWKIPTEDYIELSATVRSALSAEVTEGSLHQQDIIVVNGETSECYEPLNASITNLACDLDATILSVNFGDLSDLSWQFDLQTNARKQSKDTIPTPHSDYKFPESGDLSPSDHLVIKYFDALSKRKDLEPTWDGDAKFVNPVEAMISAAINLDHQKGTANEQQKTAKTSSRPVLIYVSNIGDFKRVEKGLDCIQTINTAIQARRCLGNKIILITSTLSGNVRPKPVWPWDTAQTPIEELLSVLKSRADTVVSLGIEDLDSKSSKLNEERRLYANRLWRSLQHIVPTGLFTNCSELVNSYLKSEFCDDESVTKILKGKDLSDPNSRKASRLLHARLIQNQTLTVDDIKEVLTIVHRHDKTPDEDEADASSRAFKERMSKIGLDCNEEEKAMLECVIDTAKIDTKFQDVIIEPEIKDGLKQLILLSHVKPHKHPLFRQVQTKGALLYGPPGTGKTHLTRAVAHDCGATMIAVDASQLLVKWVGDTEKNIRALFSLCRKLHPSILFLDEADSLFYRRGSSDQSWRRNQVTLFLQEMDGLLVTEKSPFVIIATNRPSDLDEAFLRRLPYKIAFSLPNEKQRASILRLFVKEEDVEDPIILEQLVRKTEGFSGADIKSLCGQAALAWAVEQSHKTESSRDETKQMNGNPPPDAKLLLTAQHFFKALKRARPTSAMTIRKMNQDFEQDAAPKTRIRS